MLINKINLHQIFCKINANRDIFHTRIILIYGVWGVFEVIAYLKIIFMDDFNNREMICHEKDYHIGICEMRYYSNPLHELI